MPRSSTEWPEWSIERNGRAWTTEELEIRFRLLPEKIEVFWGKLYWDDLTRLLMLAMLLENLGIDAAVRLGDRAVWQQALDELDQESSSAADERG